MLLQVRDTKAYPLQTINYPAYAVLAATGEPGGQRRWSVHLVWNLGKISRGHLDTESQWLHKLLDTLVIFERANLGFRQNPNRRLLHKVRRKQLRLLIPPILGRSVRNTVDIYCLEGVRMRWVQDYPKD